MISCNNQGAAMVQSNLPISAFIICKDEERLIENCIRSLHFCSEIIIVDSGSTDRTHEIIEKLRLEGFPIRFMIEKWRGYGAQKQFALEQCTQDWLLSIDSDERVSEKLSGMIPLLIADSEVDGYRLTRFNYLNGFGYVPPASHERHHPRMFRRGKGRFDPSDIVHEGIKIDGRVRKVRVGGLLHFRPIPLDQQMLKENKYSTLKAQLKRNRGVPSYPMKMIVSPPVFFFRWYIGHGHWRCGWAGFVQSMLGAIYSFLTEAKRWEAEAMERVPPIEPRQPPGY
jgi:glycosyltransferase involved in cell wall biosynthesis